MDSFGEFRWLTLASNRGKRVWSLNKFLAHGAKFQFKTKYDCPMIQGVSKKRYVSDFLSYFSSRGRILHFHLCFGIRISSPFDLNPLNIPIRNIKCPKNTKNTCADITMLSRVPLLRYLGLFFNHCGRSFCWTMLSSPLASHHPSVTGSELWNDREMIGETHGSTFHALKKK